MKRVDQVVGPTGMGWGTTPTLVGYEITGEPLPDSHVAKLPDRVHEEIEEIHALLHTDPHAALSRLSKLSKKQRSNPLVYNFLIAAHQKVGDQEKARALILESYRRWPDYLFAKINYAHQCLREGKVDQVPEVFEHKLDLKLLYPSRDRFHVSEAINFMGVLALYFHQRGDPESADVYYHLMKKIDRKRPVTRSVKRVLHPPLLFRLLARMGRKLEERVSQRQTDAEHANTADRRRASGSNR